MKDLHFAKEEPLGANVAEKKGPIETRHSRVHYSFLDAGIVRTRIDCEDVAIPFPHFRLLEAPIDLTKRERGLLEEGRLKGIRRKPPRRSFKIGRVRGAKWDISRTQWSERRVKAQHGNA